ncbi:MAG: hypothetical protein JW786_05915 [Desulfobacterales bacterium]|nr:hypothetical protein [Desulfobacterales bacterium]
MDNAMNRKFYISGMGEFFKKSLGMFAEKITDRYGNEISIESIEVGQKGFAIFKSGTGFSRTSFIRII